MSAKPFLKWAGGKTQLIEQIEAQLPKRITEQAFTFVEPFVGSGAVLFWVLDRYPYLDKAVINDINRDLINCYLSIKSNVEEVIKILLAFEAEYYRLLDDKAKKERYYYAKRALFNQRVSDQITQSALFIFLNRTCYNGLYRVNKNNEFNVPIGSYKKPQICNIENLRLVAKALQKVIILNGDFSQTLAYSSKNSFFYLDPPYKPISKTSSFNAYAQQQFDDNEQIRLAQFCAQLDAEKNSWILSNSDLKGEDPKNNFFDNLYSNFTILRVDARRNINANPSKRGKLTELLITN